MTTNKDNPLLKDSPFRPAPSPEYRTKYLVTRRNGILGWYKEGPDGFPFESLEEAEKKEGEIFKFVREFFKKENLKEGESMFLISYLKREGWCS